MTSIDAQSERRDADRHQPASSVGLPGVSLVLPTIDRGEMARAALASVLSGDVVPDEIVVVDQSSPPMTEDDLAGLASAVGGCKLRVERCARGLSRAVNHGARVASEDVLVVIHDDVVVDADWLRVLVSALAEHGQGSVVTGRVGASDPERPGAFAPALRDDPAPAVYRGRVERCVIRPMNIALWRREHLAMGGYDERLGPGTAFPGGEDQDYSVRLLDAGLVVHYVPAARVRHRAWRDRSDYLPLRWAYGLAHGAFYARSYDRSDPFILRRISSDVRRRLRLIPHALVTEPRVGIGHIVFLVGSLIGVVRWGARYGYSSKSPATLARPTIPRLPGDRERPRWSVMIPAFNCGRFLDEAVASVVEQDIDDMQIEIIDDHSTSDDPAAAARRVGNDRVTCHRHPENRGNIAAFNSCLERSTGRYVHLLHGDDRVLPGFYERLGSALDEHPECVAAICGHQLIDDDGDVIRRMPMLSPHASVLDDLFVRFLGGNLIQAPAIVVRREAYEAIGGFDSRIVTYGEDWEMWTRVSSLGPIWYDPAILAEYRVHAGSITSSTRSTTRTIDDMSQVIAINRELAERLLEPSVARRRSRDARRWAASRTARRALRCVDRGDDASGRALMRAAILTSPSPTLLLYAAAMPVRFLLRWVNAGRVTSHQTSDSTSTPAEVRSS